MRILIIEDDQSLNRIVTKRFIEKGFAADSCFDGEDGLYYMEAMEYDCVILDWMLPKMDGVTVLRLYRQHGGKAPVLFLTARDAVTDRVEGLDTGADDYLIKPFAFDELFARVRALTRRKKEAAAAVTSIGNLTMDHASHKVERGGRRIELTSKEYALLEYLMQNKDVVLTRSQIEDHVWNYAFDYDSNIVDVYIGYLRKKVDADFENPLIHTVRGYGYVMREKNEEISNL